ncbi:MAG: DNA-directed RNA polymerase subunit omega [Melioribacteraceae bacterium]|nr:MAG: DNA-directed RNA polymerase subunit omega [Melioribacteraceae bacterium]
MNRIIPVDLRRVEGVSSNVYEAIIVAAKRARQINDDNRLEYNTILNSLAVGNDDDFEEKENPDQLKAALEFEKRPKPHLHAMEQVLSGQVKYRYKEDENSE